MKMKKYISFVMVGLLTHLLSACIDEDLSDCPPKEKEVMVDYQIDLTHEIDPDYDARLQTLHLGFWDSQEHLYKEIYFGSGDMPEELVFTVTLPVKNYEHIAIANHDKDGISGEYEPYPNDISQVKISENPYAPDTIKALKYPPFVGSEPMYMADEPDKTHYSVLLHPVTARVNIMVNHPATLTNTRCFLANTKAGYACWTNAFLINDKLITDATDFKTEESNAELTRFSFYSYPTVVAEFAKSGTKADTEGAWKLYFYSDCGDKIVQHIFTVREPLEAGRVFNGEFTITEQGGESVDVDASVTIDTDWTPGDNFDQDI